MPSCSRSPTRRGANGTGTCSTRDGDVTTTTHAEGDARVAVPADGRRVPRRVDGSRRRAEPAHRGRTRRRTMFEADLALRRATARPRAARSRVLARYPLLPLRVSAAIYRQATRLFVRRVPVYRIPPDAGSGPPMKSTTSAASVSLDAVAVRCSNGSRGGTLELVDPVGARALRRHAAASTLHRRIDVTVTVHDPRRTPGSCARAASASASRTPTAGGTPTTSPAFLRLAHRSLARTHTRTRPRSTGSLRPSSIRSLDGGAADKERDAANVRAHYDLGNELFQRLLDETMMYSCARASSRRTTRSTDASLAQARPARRDARARARAIGCSRSAPGGAASRSTRRARTAATSRRRRSRDASTSYAQRRVRRGLERSRDRAARRLPRPRRRRSTRSSRSR